MIDYTVNHDFKVEDIVYVAIKHKVRKCKIIFIDEYIDYSFDNHNKEIDVLKTRIDLLDLTLDYKDKNEIYTYVSEYICNIKRTIEELIAD